ncbi:family 16 glycosylhydrolase, partial [bacterium]|nr:family 16 glycosylhydrolase [bacterium]
LTTSTLVVDNADPGAAATGDWTTADALQGHYGDDYMVHGPGSDSNNFIWTPDITTPTLYRVYVNWTTSTLHAVDARYFIHHDDGVTAMMGDQRYNGGTWILLGTYPMDGLGDYVELEANPSAAVVADAMRIEPIAPVGPPGDSTWREVWRDDFEGTSVDWDVWDSSDGLRTEFLSRHPENAEVSDGLLKIVSHKESRYPGTIWTTGFIWTEQGFDHGYFEARMRYCPIATNNAFWLWRVGGENYPTLEIDINEGHLPSEVAMTTHYYQDSSVERYSSGMAVDVEGVDLSDDFHIYAAEWNEQEITFFTDGKPLRTIPRHYYEPGHLEHVMFSTMAYEDTPDEMDGKSMDVDWVRVFEYKTRGMKARPAAGEVSTTGFFPTLIDQDFEKTPIGGLPPNWMLTEGDAAVDYSPGLSGTRCLRLKAPADSTLPFPTVFVPFDTQTDPVEVTYNLLAEKFWDKWLFVVTDSFDYPNYASLPDPHIRQAGPYVRWYDGNLPQYYDTAWHPMARVPNDRWVTIRYVLDPALGVFDFYVEDMEHAEVTGEFRYKRGNVGGLIFRKENETKGSTTDYYFGQSLWIDNVKVRILGAEPPPPPLPPASVREWMLWDE